MIFMLTSCLRVSSGSVRRNLAHNALTLFFHLASTEYRAVDAFLTSNVLTYPAWREDIKEVEEKYCVEHLTLVQNKLKYSKGIRQKESEMERL